MKRMAERRPRPDEVVLHVDHDQGGVRQPILGKEHRLRSEPPHAVPIAAPAPHVLVGDSDVLAILP